MTVRENKVDWFGGMLAWKIGTTRESIVSSIDQSINQAMSVGSLIERHDKVDMIDMGLDTFEGDMP